MATNEELLAHIAQLNSNQQSLMEELNNLKAAAVPDPLSYYKTPDPIKNLPIFSGNKRETLAWVEEVEDTLELFKTWANKPIYPQLIRAVKGKITGDAREILIAAGNPSNWAEIKEVLLHSYGDKRDLASHIQSLFYVTLGKKTITEYYNKIKQIETSIRSTANSVDEFKGANKQLGAFVGLLSTTRYVDGLGENLSMIVRSHKPTSLEEAYNYALQYSNAAYRQKLEKKNRDPQPFNLQKPIQPPPAKHYTPPTKQFGNKSERFKTTDNVKAQIANDDVSMRTYRSKGQINNHEDGGNEEHKDESYAELDSDDNDYFVSGELNFQMEESPEKEK